MFKFYTADKVKKIIARIEQEYEGVLTSQRKRIIELTEENRDLSAKLSIYEYERSHVASAIISAEQKGQEIRESADAYAKARRDGVYRLAERCRALAAALAEKYPAEADVKEFNTYIQKLDEALETNGEGELDMDKILYPDANLKLENLCKELGLMDDVEEE
ncbi:MAG: hypothetical protein IJY26_04305 [Clostridia bacterium]|nr:hypothetical protein [Clostridia bacterium]